MTSIMRDEIHINKKKKAQMGGKKKKQTNFCIRMFLLPSLPGYFSFAYLSHFLTQSVLLNGQAYRKAS